MSELEVKREGFLPRISLEDIRELKSQYDLFRKLQRDVLEEGIDYGFPAGRRSPEQKPSLYKSGAEKLLRLFNLSPSFEIISEKETDDFIMYKFKCILRSATGRPIGEGYGACNSREKQGWNANPWAFQNNILKMAKKRSLVDAVLTGLGASNVFTQDLEDMEDVPTQNEQDTKPVPRQNASKKQIDYLLDLIDKLAKKQRTKKEHLFEFIYKAENISDLSQLSREKASELIERISKKLEESQPEVIDEGEVISDDLREIQNQFAEEAE
jgi:hypothetical protein